MITVCGRTIGPYPLNEAMRRLFEEATHQGIDPDAFRNCMVEKWKIWIARDCDKYDSLIQAASNTPQADHKASFDPARFFVREQEVIRRGTTAYIMSRKWGDSCKIVIPRLQAGLPHLGIEMHFL